jgi:hypothetical protein
MQARDALFNWLQMKIVAEARPTDQAAKETMDFFYVILTEDLHIHEITVHQENDVSYVVHYEQEHHKHTLRIDREAVEKLLADINENPIYNQQYGDET